MTKAHRTIIICHIIRHTVQAFHMHAFYKLKSFQWGKYRFNTIYTDQQARKTSLTKNNMKTTSVYECMQFSYVSLKDK